MGFFSENLCRGERRVGQALCLLLVLSALSACTLPSPKEENREDTLRQHVRAFHWAMIGQDVPIALRYVPPEDREAWDHAFTCLFEQVRLLDYRVSLVKFEHASNEASVTIRWTGHPADSLVVKELLWREQWSFNSAKQRWSLQPGPNALKGLPQDCVHEIPEREGPDEEASPG